MRSRRDDGARYTAVASPSPLAQVVQPWSMQMSHSRAGSGARLTTAWWTAPSTAGMTVAARAFPPVRGRAV